MTENNSIKNAIRIANITANPAPLGLLAFSMTTVLLNLHNAGHSAMYTGLGQLMNEVYKEPIIRLG